MQKLLAEAMPLFRSYQNDVRRLLGGSAAADFARNWLGIFAIATFIFHLYVLFSFDVAISKFRDGLDWIYMTYFTGLSRLT